MIAEHGTIEGHLVELDAQCGRSRIVIVDDLSRHQTRCYIRNAELEEKARRHWKHRVGVSGRIISTDHTGYPVEMEVEDIYPLRHRDRLPQIDDIAGIDITGGIESSEYVSSLRAASFRG